MKNLQLVTAMFAIAGLAQAANVTGKVTYKGAAVKPATIKMNADPVCVKENAGKTVTSEEMLVGSGGSLGNVFVYVKEGFKGTPPPAPTEPVTFDQHGCHYLPHVFGIRVGQPLKIVNSDPTLHNVNAQAKVNSKFNAGMPTKGQTIEKKFTKPEVLVKFKCDVHGWMNAYAGVVDHPFFAVSDKSGAFTVKDLPEGEYTLEAVHEKLGAKTAKVTVTATGTAAPVEFTF